MQGFDTVVIGGGLVGWSTAYRLLKAGQRVAVVDAGVEGYATQAGAGIIAPGASFKSPDAFFPLATAAMRYYPELMAELAGDQAGETGYATVGGLFVARDEAEYALLPAAMATMAERRDGGLGNIGELTMLTGAEAKALFPALADLPGAIHMADAARVNGRLLRNALRTAAAAHGVEEIAGAATLAGDGNRVVVSVNGEQVSADAIVLSAGAWSDGLSQAIGLEVPVHPQRGQIMHFDLPDQDTNGWPIVEGFYSHYILTFGPNRVVCGATREHDAGFDVRVTAEGVAEVLAEALLVAPGLGSATIAEIRVGLRPFSRDSLPLIGRAPGHENLFLCTGHGPSGLQLGPYSGAAVAALVLGHEPGVDLKPFSPTRFL